MRPILAGHLKYADLDDPKMDLFDFVLMNEAMDVHAENTWRVRNAREK